MTSRTTVILALSTALALALAGCGEKQVSYRRDVAPILQSECAVCHLPGRAGYVKSGFSVASYADVMKGTKYGRVVIPGDALSSTLVRLIRHQADPTINMPKKYSVLSMAHEQVILPSDRARNLSGHDVDIIARWVNQGAKDN